MSIGQIAEIVTMAFLGSVLIRLGWKLTMTIGVLGHAVRFAVYAYFPNHPWLIVAVQILHGICYAFFFATVYIFVDEYLPKDARASAQGLFNVMILGLGAPSWPTPSARTCGSMCLSMRESSIIRDFSGSLSVSL